MSILFVWNLLLKKMKTFVEETIEAGDEDEEDNVELNTGTTIEGTEAIIDVQ